MPALSDAILGAQYARGRGHLWPFALVWAFALAARRLGAEIRTGVGVERLLRAGDRVTGVVANGEAIQADDVILATNAYTPALLPELPPGAIVPARGQILVTQAVPPLLPHPFGTNFDKEYGRQTPDGKILCGGFRRLRRGRGARPLRGARHARGPRRHRPHAGDALPEARRRQRRPRLGGDHGLHGRRAAPDRQDARQRRGCSWRRGSTAAGSRGRRRSASIAAAELGGQAHGFDLAPFDPGRFEGDGTAWSNPFTAGERSEVGDSATFAAAGKGRPGGTIRETVPW